MLKQSIASRLLLPHPLFPLLSRLRSSFQDACTHSLTQAAMCRSSFVCRGIACTYTRTHTHTLLKVGCKDVTRSPFLPPFTVHLISFPLSLFLASTSASSPHCVVMLPLSLSPSHTLALAGKALSIFPHRRSGDRKRMKERRKTISFFAPPSSYQE